MSYQKNVKIKKTKIIKSNRKSISMVVNSDLTLTVKAPRLLPNFMIRSFIQDHDDWIQKQLKKLESKPLLMPKNYNQNESFLFLGMQLKLNYGNYLEIRVKDDRLLVPEGFKFRIQKQILLWYKKQARVIITKQLDHYAKMMETTYSSLTFSDTKSQWGSCSRENNLQFSWRLIMTPITVINYVVVHELAHTIEKNHSKNFWEIVNKYYPSYKRQIKWLKENGNTLVI